MAVESSNEGCGCCREAVDRGRRRTLGSMLALAVSPLLSPAALAAGGGRDKQPKPGDRLAFMIGDRKNEAIGPDDIEIGKAPTLAYPQDAASGEVLMSRASLLAIVRVPEDTLSEPARAQAAGGVVAFSALCTHYGCPISSRDTSQTLLVCNCHGSAFDPADRGAVVKGPALRRLAMLPLNIEDGLLVVSAPLDGPIGPPT